MFFVLIVSVFFYGSTNHEPEAVSKVMPSIEACRAEGTRLVAIATRSPKVSYAKKTCLTLVVEPGEKL
jgi:hypothetical protein